MGPFTWTKTADEILERLASYLQRIPGTGRLAAFLRAGIRQVAAPSFVNRNGDTDPRQAAIRYPEAVRPWQHVLEPLTGYLRLAESLGPHRHDTAWNFGPAAEVWLTVAQVADRVAELWEGDVGWGPEEGPQATRLLTLDSAKARSELGWIPTIDVQRSIEMTVEWEKAVDEGEHARTVTERQVDEHLRLQSE